MIKANLEKLIETAVTGQICHPYAGHYPDLKVAFDGTAFVPVGYSGINYTVRVGDSAFDWAGGDHVEPGVAIRNCDERANTGLNMLACVGDEATITSARMDGKDVKLQGTTGTVTGKHAGERVLVYFPKRVLDRLCVGDLIQIRASGVGTKLLDYPGVTVANTSPRLLKALNPSEKGGKIRVPVTKMIPGKLVGGGVGLLANPQAGDFDIQSTSVETVKEYSLDAIRIGDVVAVTDYDATYGLRWQPGAITIGVVAHGSSRRSGHGPGLNVLFTSSQGYVEPIITRKANLVELLGLS